MANLLVAFQPPRRVLTRPPAIELPAEATFTALEKSSGSSSLVSPVASPLSHDDGRGARHRKFLLPEIWELLPTAKAYISKTLAKKTNLSSCKTPNIYIYRKKLE